MLHGSHVDRKVDGNLGQIEGDVAGDAFAIHAGWFSAYIKTGIERWAVIVKNSGVELESQVVAMLTALARRRGVRSGCSI